MRISFGFLLYTLLGATVALAQSFDVVTDKQLPNDNEKSRNVGFLGSSDGNVVQCRAPFGDLTYFLFDRGGKRLLLVQHDLARSAELSEDALDEFRAEIASEKARYESTMHDLLGRPEVSEEFKKRVKGIPYTQLPPDTPNVLAVPSSPENGAKAEPDFTALNAEVAAFRSKVIQSRLTSEIHTQLLSCAYNFSKLPMRVTDQSTGMTIRFIRDASNSNAKTDWRTYSRVSLREMLINFGHTIEQHEVSR